MHERVAVAVGGIIVSLCLGGCDKPEPSASPAPQASQTVVNTTAAPSATSSETPKPAMTADELLAQPISPQSFVDPNPRSNDSLDSGINFSRAGLPNFVAGAAGLSGVETEGRWSDAKLAPYVFIAFKNPLPTRFELEITAMATGENTTKPIIVEIDHVRQSFIVGTGTTTHRLIFSTKNAAKEIRILPPEPVAPQDKGWGNDPRKLGIFLKFLKIHAP